MASQSMVAVVGWRSSELCDGRRWAARGAARARWRAAGAWTRRPTRTRVPKRLRPRPR